MTRLALAAALLLATQADAAVINKGGIRFNGLNGSNQPTLWDNRETWRYHPIFLDGGHRFRLPGALCLSYEFNPSRANGVWRDLDGDCLAEAIAPPAPVEPPFVPTEPPAFVPAPPMVDPLVPVDQPPIIPQEPPTVINPPLTTPTPIPVPAGLSLMLAALGMLWVTRARA